jgi:hypothetical protein
VLAAAACCFIITPALTRIGETKALGSVSSGDASVRMRRRRGGGEVEEKRRRKVV